VGAKVEHAIEVGMDVIACVGETLAEREAGAMFSVLDAQLTGVGNKVNMHLVIGGELHKGRNKLFLLVVIVLAYAATQERVDNQTSDAVSLYRIGERGQEIAPFAHAYRIVKPKPAA
jgi:hypothetical protein